MGEARVGNKIRKWDEVTGVATETVDNTVSEQVADGIRNPIRTLEDQVEQNDNMLDGIINNLPEETIVEKEERTSVVSKLKGMEPRADKKSKQQNLELVLQ